jgi:hypothetical protein
VTSTEVFVGIKGMKQRQLLLIKVKNYGEQLVVEG